ncbi:MAG: S8/S53 family peptidase [Actinomycetota bacterium]
MASPPAERITAAAKHDVLAPLSAFGRCFTNDEVFGEGASKAAQELLAKAAALAEKVGELGEVGEVGELSEVELQRIAAEAIERAQDTGIEIEPFQWIAESRLTAVVVRPPEADPNPVDDLADELEKIGIAIERSSAVFLGKKCAVERLTLIVPKDFDDIESLARALDPLSGAMVEMFHNYGYRPGSISFKPGSVSFKPGSISFKPGSVSFKPGSVSFKPGSISFKGESLIPEPATCPNDVLERTQRVRWKAVMGVATEPDPVQVAILDTGVDAHLLQHHPLFAGWEAPDQIGASPDFETVPDPSDVVHPYFGHGSMVAGLVALRAPLALINHETIRNRSGLSDAYELARDLPDIEHADIVVMSVGTSAPSAEDVPAMREIIRLLLERGKVVVAAHGMLGDLDNPNDKLFPAGFTLGDLQNEGETEQFPGRLVTVRALDCEKKPIPGSRDADDQTKTRIVQFSRIATGVLTAFPAGRYRFGRNRSAMSYDGWARGTGTSFAAPIVAGELARLMAHDATTDGTRLTGAEAVEALEKINLDDGLRQL